MIKNNNNNLLVHCGYIKTYKIENRAQYKTNFWLKMSVKKKNRAHKKTKKQLKT